MMYFFFVLKQNDGLSGTAGKRIAAGFSYLVTRQTTNLMGNQQHCTLASSIGLFISINWNFNQTTRINHSVHLSVLKCIRECITSRNSPNSPVACVRIKSSFVLPRKNLRNAIFGSLKS